MSVRKRDTVEDTQDPADNARRLMNTFMGYWHVCGVAGCKRKRGCAGDPHACFDRWWPVTPEAMKVEFRAIITALGAGRTPQQALDDAKAEVARAADHIARIDASWRAAQEAREQVRGQASDALLPGAETRRVPSSTPDRAERKDAPRVRGL